MLIVKQYNDEINLLIKKMLSHYHLEHCDILFDDLIAKPEHTLKYINNCLGFALVLDDLKAVYNKPLYQKIRGKKVGGWHGVFI